MSLLTTILYQPFFNLLVFFYYLLEQIPGFEPDMGIAVILLTITIRILMLPLTIASTRTKTERHQIEKSVKKIRQATHLPPDKSKSEVKKILRSNRRVVISEGINFVIQMIIFFILYRIFTTGLLGEDLHLLYDFMPPVHTPFNLLFLGRFDLTHTNLTLNLIQSLVILAVEAINLFDSPFPVDRNDIVRYLITLPIASFVIFMFLPAGKKLFIITTLAFSFFYTLTRIMYRGFTNIFSPPTPTPDSSSEKPADLA